MKSIILAAGQGSRLMPLTADKPKCLVKLRGKSLLEWQLEALRRCDIQESIIVTGYCAEQLNSFGSRRIFNPDFLATNMVASLFCAEEEMEGDVLISYGDIVFSPNVVETALSSPWPIAVVFDKDWLRLWSARMADPLSDAETLKLSAEGKILELGQKPRALSDIQGQYIGMIKLSGDIVPEIRRFYHQLDRSEVYDGRAFKQMFMTTFLSRLIAAGFPVYGAPISGDWCEVDTGEDLLCYEKMDLEFLPF